MTFLDKIGKLEKLAPAALEKLAPQALETIDRIAPRSLTAPRQEALAQRQAEKRAADAAREASARAAHRAQVAETVNQPFLEALRAWTRPEWLDLQPVPVRKALTKVGERSRALLAGVPAVNSGERVWADAEPTVLDLLMRAAEAARAENPRLALHITELLLVAKPASRGSWRQRALAAEVAGDLTTAIRAHEAYLDLTQDDGLGVIDRLRRLRDREDRRVRFLTVLDAALRATDALPGPVLDAVRNLDSAMRNPTPRAEVDQAVAGVLKHLTALPVPDLTRVTTQDLLHHTSRWQRYVELTPAPMAEEDARTLTVLQRSELRGQLRGKRVGLVSADPMRLRDAGLGRRVDRYDVVVRFGPLGNTKVDAGARTDLQVIRHDAADGWDVEAQLRLVLTDRPDERAAALRGRLVPGRQHAVTTLPAGDDSTAAFRLLRLLDRLDVCEAVDLIGFDPEHDFTEDELTWLAPRLERRDSHLIGVR